MAGIAVQPLQRGQFVRSSIEIVETVGRMTHVAETTVNGQKTDEVSLVSPVSGSAPQAFSQLAIKVPTQISQWSAALEQRFARLAARVATESASVNEQREFSSLQNARRQTHLARSGAEVLRDFEQRQRTAALVAALRKYVEPLPTG
jgi:hypothetical protein